MIMQRLLTAVVIHYDARWDAGAPQRDVPAPTTWRRSSQAPT